MNISLISTDLDEYYNNINNFEKCDDEKIVINNNNYNYEYLEFDDFEKYNNLKDLIYDDIEIKPKKNRIFCENCNNDDIVEDTSQGNLVCKQCGQVISTLVDSNPEWTQYNDDNKKDMNRCSQPINKLLPQSSTATTIAGSCSSRIRVLHGWGAMPYKERSLNEVFKTIQKMCSKGKIFKCIEDDAKIMYKNISDCKHKSGKNKDKSIIIRGKNRTSLIAACVLFACRKKDETRSPKEIAELFDIKYTEITKGCKIFSKLAKIKNMEIVTNFTKPEHFITRFCDELKIKKQYAEQSIKISNNVHKLQIASVHTPLSLATGAIYLMIYLNKLNIQKKVIAEKFNVSQVTIAKAFKKLEPFINILTNDDVCDRLSVEIKKYQDDIQIGESLKPKFLRFNIDIKKILNKDQREIFNIYDENNHSLNEKLIIEHNIEFDNLDKQLENEFIKLNIERGDIIYNDLKKKIIFSKSSFKIF